MAYDSLLLGTPLESEPKRNNRFILEFPAELNIPSQFVRTSDRPKVEVNNVKIPFVNGSSYVLGRYEWQTLTFTFIDPIGISISQKLMEAFRLGVESVTGRMGYAAGYQKDLVLSALDPVGTAIERWVLKESHIISADFGSNDMDNDELQMPSITVQPRYCVLEY